MTEGDRRVLPRYPPGGFPPGGPHYMEQNPTTSFSHSHLPQYQQQEQQQQQQQQWHQMQAMQQQHYSTSCIQERNAPAPYPRSPSRMPPVNPQTMQWMNQHYAYNNSPIPSVTPSLISVQMYPDDMSMLSVNTNHSVIHGIEPEHQRCFSSNGSARENINPNRALAMRDGEAINILDAVMQRWFDDGEVNIRRRVDSADRVYMWLKNNGLAGLTDHCRLTCMQRIGQIIVNGLWFPSEQHPPQEYFDLAMRLIETMNRVMHYPGGVSVMTTFFLMDFQPPNPQPPLRVLLIPFIGRHDNQIFDRISKTIIDVFFLFITQSDPGARTQCLKSMKIVPAIVNQLIRSLADGQHNNSKLLNIFNKFAYMDRRMKEYFFRITPHPVIYTVLHLYLPRCMQSPMANPETRSQVLADACRLLKTLVYDAQSINKFISFNGIQIICSNIRFAAEVRTIREALVLFKEVSDSNLLMDVEIPAEFIFQLIYNYWNDEIIAQHGTGFLINIVANKPRYKNIAIRCNCIQLLDSIISNCPEITNSSPDKRFLVLDIYSNCVHTLNNLLPYWLTGAVEISAQQKMNVLETVQRLLSEGILRKFMNLLVYEEPNLAFAGHVMDLRHQLLKLLITLVKAPIIKKDRLLEIFDDIRKEHIVGNLLHVFSLGRMLYMENVSDSEKSKRELLLVRTLRLLQSIMVCNQLIAINDIRRVVANYFIHNGPCPLEMIGEKTGDVLITVLLEYCASMLELCGGEVPALWNFDRAMIEGFANKRNADIATAAQNLLSKLPAMAAEFEPLAEVFAQPQYFY